MNGLNSRLILDKISLWAKYVPVPAAIVAMALFWTWSVVLFSLGFVDGFIYVQGYLEHTILPLMLLSALFWILSPSLGTKKELSKIIKTVTLRSDDDWGVSIKSMIVLITMATAFSFCTTLTKNSSGATAIISIVAESCSLIAFSIFYLGY